MPMQNVKSGAMKAIENRISEAYKLFGKSADCRNNLSDANKQAMLEQAQENMNFAENVYNTGLPESEIEVARSMMDSFYSYASNFKKPVVKDGVMSTSIDDMFNVFVPCDAGVLEAKSGKDYFRKQRSYQA